MSREFILCMIAPEFMPFWGGTGAVTLNIIRSLPRSVEIHVITPHRAVIGKNYMESKSDSEVLNDNVHIHHVSQARDTFFYNAHFQLSCLRAIPRLHKEYKIDLIHTHHAHMPDILLRLFKRLDIKTICSVHNLFPWMMKSINSSGLTFLELDRSEKAIRLLFPFLKLCESFFLRNMDLLIAPSQHCKAELKKFLSMTSARIDVVYNGVDTQVFVPNCIACGDEPTVLFAGRPVAQKGIFNLVKAMRIVIRYTPRARFIFAGGGDFSPYIRIFEKMGISDEHSKYLGHVDHSDMPKIYCQNKVFVLPSPHENCSMSIIEAMSCGKAVIASNVGGNPELIESGKDGILYNYGDSEELAEKIILLLEDSSLREELGRRAREKAVKRFSARRMGEEIIRIYERTVQS